MELILVYIRLLNNSFFLLPLRLSTLPVSFQFISDVFFKFAPDPDSQNLLSLFHHRSSFLSSSPEPSFTDRTFPVLLQMV